MVYVNVAHPNCSFFSSFVFVCLGMQIPLGAYPWKSLSMLIADVAIYTSNETFKFSEIRNDQLEDNTKYFYSN